MGGAIDRIAEATTQTEIVDQPLPVPQPSAMGTCIFGWVICRKDFTVPDRIQALPNAFHRCGLFKPSVGRKNKQANAFPLLALPRELRDSIYMFSLFDADPPVLPIRVHKAELVQPQKTLADRHKHFRRIRQKIQGKRKEAAPSVEPIHSTMLSLSLTSKQLKAEAQEAFFRYAILESQALRKREVVQSASMEHYVTRSTFVLLKELVTSRDLYNNLRYVNLYFSVTDTPTTVEQMDLIGTDYLSRLSKYGITYVGDQCLYRTWRSNIRLALSLPNIRKLVLDLRDCVWYTEHYSRLVMIPAPVAQPNLNNTGNGHSTGGQNGVPTLTLGWSPAAVQTPNSIPGLQLVVPNPAAIWPQGWPYLPNHIRGIPSNAFGAIPPPAGTPPPFLPVHIPAIPAPRAVIKLATSAIHARTMRLYAAWSEEDCSSDAVADQITRGVEVQLLVAGSAVTEVEKELTSSGGWHTSWKPGPDSARLRDVTDEGELGSHKKRLQFWGYEF